VILVADMGEIRNVLTFLVGKRDEEKQPLGTPGVDNIIIIGPQRERFPDCGLNSCGFG
jgi:hypothetical protein